MNRIQEVVHKFRSGSTEKRESTDAGVGGRRGTEPRVVTGQITGRMANSGLPSVSAVLAQPPDEGSAQTRWYVAPPIPPSSSEFSVPPPLQPLPPPPFSSSLSLLSSSPSSAGVATERSELSALPILTPSGLQQTTLASLGHSDPVAIVPGNADSAPSASQHSPLPERKGSIKMRPKGTLEYKVSGKDTLEKIAARFDVTPSELKKLNRMSSRMVFENQVLYIPDPDFVPSDPPTPEPEISVSPTFSPLHQPPKLDLPIVMMSNKPPTRVPGHAMKVPSPPSSAPPQRTPVLASLPRALSEDEARKLDEECYERFIKVASFHIRKGFIQVAGTLLVTPNAIMFDPEAQKEEERKQMVEAGGVVVYMDTILSASLYHDLSGRQDTSKQSPILDSSTQHRTASPSQNATDSGTPSTDLTLARESTTVQGLSSSASDSVEGMHSATDQSGVQPCTDSSVALRRDGVSGMQTTQDPRLSGKPAVRRRSDDNDDNDSGDVQIDTEHLAVSVSAASSVGGQATAAAVHALSLDLGGLEPGCEAVSTGIFSQETHQHPLHVAHSLSSESVPTNGWSEKTKAETLSSASKLGLGEKEVAAVDTDAECDVNTNKDTKTDADIKALLAGGRRDSVHANDTGRASSIFYPTTPEEVSKATGEMMGREDSAQQQEEDDESSDSQVRQCADKLVSEILESVSWSSGLSRAVETVGEQGEMSEGSKFDLKGGEDEEVERVREGAETGIWKVGQEGRNPSGARPPTGVEPDTTTITETPATTTTHPHTTRPRPPPLSDVHIADTINSSQLEGARLRSESGTFSPLRSSVQHLTSFVDYAAGLLRVGLSEEKTGGGRVNEVPLVKEKSVPSSTSPSSPSLLDERCGKEEEGEHGAVSVAGSSMFYVRRSPALDEQRWPMSSQSADQREHSEEGAPSPNLYLHLAVDDVECNRRFHTTWSPSQDCPPPRTNPQYWFSFPRSKADHLYAFFTQWQPETFAEEEEPVHKHAFVVVEGNNIKKGSDIPAFILDFFGDRGHNFKKDWEILSREEATRLGILSVDGSIMPELTHQSSILTEQHILQLAGSLPARTVGYKWSLAYSTSLHGFSLKRLYREVARIDSPILLVLRDTENTVFGAFLSDPPKPSDHFYGTGMCQLWTFKDKFRYFKWSGENVFFIKGDENSMSVGAGQGVYGLWLDSDLYHGRSHQCSTFNNIVLTSKEDFCIAGLEAWAFLSD